MVFLVSKLRSCSLVLLAASRELIQFISFESGSTLEDRLAEACERALGSLAKDFNVAGTSHPLETQIQVFLAVRLADADLRAEAFNFDNEAIVVNLNEIHVAGVAASNTDLAVEALLMDSSHGEVTFK